MKLQLWHGGRYLESNYRDMICAKNKWEYGPGLYLTTSYLRAKQYAKGGGNTYLVDLDLGTEIDKVNIKMDMVLSFIDEYIIKSKKKLMLEDIHYHIKRLNKCDDLNLNVFLNLIINNNALLKSKTKKLCEFLVNNGADYCYVSNYSGNNEDVYVIFNRKQIKSVEKKMSQKIDVNQYELKNNKI